MSLVSVTGTGFHNLGAPPYVAPPPESAGELLIGIGAVTDSSAYYRARANDAANTLQIEYSTNSDLSGSTLSAGVVPSVDDDYTAGETIEGLSDDTTYHYSIVENGVRVHGSPFPKFTTCPTAGVAASFSFVAGSCNLGPNGHATLSQNVFANIAAENPLFMMHTGDLVYADTNVRELLLNGPDTGGYDERGSGKKTYYKPVYAADGDFQQYIVRNMWRDHSWDDHDFGSGSSEDGDVPGKAVNLKAFKEYTVHHALVSPSSGIWHKFTIAHCEFFVIDVRYQREGGIVRFPATAIPTLFPVADTGSSGATIVIPSASSPSASNDFYNGYYARVVTGSGTFYRRVSDYVGSTRTLTLDSSVPGLTAGVSTFHLRKSSMLDMNVIANGQTDWLVDEINASTAVFKFLVSAVPMNPTVNQNDVWGGWGGGTPQDQMELNYLAQHITADNVIVISGDRHWQAMDDGTYAHWPEVTSSRLVQDGADEADSSWSHGMNTNTEGYAVVSVTPTQVSISVKKLDGTVPVTVPLPLVVTAV